MWRIFNDGEIEVIGNGVLDVLATLGFHCDNDEILSAYGTKRVPRSKHCWRSLANRRDTRGNWFLTARFWNGADAGWE